MPLVSPRLLSRPRHIASTLLHTIPRKNHGDDGLDVVCVQEAWAFRTGLLWPLVWQVFAKRPFAFAADVNVLSVCRLIQFLEHSVEDFLVGKERSDIVFLCFVILFIVANIKPLPQSNVFIHQDEDSSEGCIPWFPWSFWTGPRCQSHRVHLNSAYCGTPSNILGPPSGTGIHLGRRPVGPKEKHL
jgi:hypothetical protein